MNCIVAVAVVSEPFQASPEGVLYSLISDGLHINHTPSVKSSWYARHCFCNTWGQDCWEDETVQYSITSMVQHWICHFNICDFVELIHSTDFALQVNKIRDRHSCTAACLYRIHSYHEGNFVQEILLLLGVSTDLQYTCLQLSYVA